MRVLVLGADGFIGRHILFALRSAGHQPVASARRASALAWMGFEVFPADLTDPATHDPAFWRPALAAATSLINAAGLLTGSEAAFEAVHVTAPQAAYRALAGGRAVLISAVGIEAETRFAYWRRQGEAVADAAGVTILRPGLVLADTSYGGSSLIRALAALPWRTPVIGDGQQPFNPIHANDLAQVVLRCLENPPGPGPWDVGGPEVVTQGQLTTLYRAWLGRPGTRLLAVPIPLARMLGRLGDALRLGPLSQTSVAQLQAGVLSHPAPLTEKLGPLGRSFSTFLAARPPGTQDLWQARLYLLKPAIRLGLGLMWFVSGLLGLLLPPGAFLPLLTQAPFAAATLTTAGRIGGVADLALAYALLPNWRPVTVGWAQFAVTLAYTAGLSLMAPAAWVEPLAGLLKNLPVLLLVLTHIALAEER